MAIVLSGTTWRDLWHDGFWVLTSLPDRTSAIAADEESIICDSDRSYRRLQKSLCL